MRLRSEQTQQTVRNSSAHGSFSRSESSPVVSYAAALPAGMRRREGNASEQAATAGADGNDDQQSVHSSASSYSLASRPDSDTEDETQAAREARLAALDTVDDALAASGLQNLHINSTGKGKKQTAARTKQREEDIIGNVLQVIKDAQSGTWGFLCFTSGCRDRSRRKRTSALRAACSTA